tara:strand:- start:9647 stop:9889 length:243 start_codon:yes stop_codon:yes gene_type:complete
MFKTSMLLTMLRPLLPKLERFLTEQEELDKGEKSKILLDVIDGKISIQIIALKQMPKDKPRKKDEIIVSQILKNIDSNEL